MYGANYASGHLPIGTSVPKKKTTHNLQELLQNITQAFQLNHSVFFPTIFDSDVLHRVRVPKFLVFVIVTHEREQDFLSDCLKNFTSDLRKQALYGCKTKDK